MNGTLRNARDSILSHPRGTEPGHRHGMDDKTAFEVEAALIDAYPGLTNVVGGLGGTEYGAMHASEIIRRYAAEEAVFQHKAILISVSKSEKPSTVVST